jgi:anti-sigma factor RsiW
MTDEPNRGTSGSVPKPPKLAFDPLEAALRQLFDDVADEPVPDDFLQLIQKLDDTKRKQKPAK